MYNNISNDAKNALKSNVVTTTARITLTSDGTIIDGNYLQNITITDQCYQDGVIIGTAMCKEVEIELIDNSFDLANKEFLLEVGVLLPNNTYEYIPYGNFIVKEYSKIVSSNHYKLIAYDYMDKFNPTFIDDNETLEDGVTYSTPMTLQSFYEYVANEYGVTIETQSNLPNANFSITQKPYFDGMSGRIVLSRLAEMMGCFAKINRNNKLEMKLKNSTNEQFSRNEMNNSLERNNMFGPINVISLRLSQVEGENITKRDKASIAQYGETTLQIEDNPFVYTQALRLSAINDIYTQVDGFSYYPTTFNGKLIYLDCGDEVEVQDMNTNTYYKTIILKQVLKIPGTRNSQFENKALTSTGLKYQFTPEQVRVNRRTEYIVDKQSQQITELVETTEELEKDVENITDTIGTEEGKHIYIDDSSDQPIISAKLYGETNQKTRNGKNKFNKEATPKLRNGISLTILNTGIRLTSTQQPTPSNYLYAIYVLKELTNYVGSTVRMKTNMTASGNNIAHIAIGLCNNDGSNRMQKAFSSTSGAIISFVVPELSDEQKYLCVWLYANSGGTGTTGDYVDYTNAIITIDDDDMTYEDYGVSPSPDYPSPIINLEPKNKFSGWIKGKSIDGTTGIETSISSSAVSDYIPVDFSVNPNYYLSGLKTSLLHWVGAYNSNKEFLGRTDVSATNYELLSSNIFTSGTAQGTGDIAYIRVKHYFLMGDTGTIDDVDTLETQLEIGNIQTDYVPFDCLKFKISNKNWINVTATTITRSGVTFTVNTDKSITINGTNTDSETIWYRLAPNFTLPAGTYTLSNGNTNVSNTNGFIFYDDNSNFNRENISTKTFSSDTTIKPYIKVNAGVTVNNQTIYPMIIQGSYTAETMPDYIEYQLQTVCFPLGDTKLMEGSYLAEDGIHHKRNQIVFDGSENWSNQSGVYDTTNRMMFMLSTSIPNDLAKRKAVCNYFTNYNGTVQNANVDVTAFNFHQNIIYSNYIYFKIERSELASEDVAGWKAWLEEHTLVVEYELAEEEIIPFTTEQQEAWDNLMSLKTYKNISNIFSEAYAQIWYVKDNGLNIYETRANANRKYIETTNKFVEQKMTNESITSTISVIDTKTDALSGEILSTNSTVNELQETVNGLANTIIEKGGNNLFYYALEYWNTTNNELNIEEYTNTDFKNNTVSGRGYIVGNGSSYQDTSETNVSVPNGIYTVSFKYKKIGASLSNASVKINGATYSLTETSWTNFTKTIEVTTNNIKVEFIADTNNTLYVADLMGNAGNIAEVWTQNPNETRTDTVTIGRGIRVESSESNTYTKIDADGNRTYNKTTNERVAEMTDKGIYAKEFECEGQAKISGLLIQQVGNQVWISSLL